MEQMKKYLRPTSAIDCDSKMIIEKAQSLTRGQDEAIDRAKSLFYFVRDEITYNLWLLTDLPEYYRASRTLERGEGFCVFKAVLLAALARAVDIPSRIGIAAIRNHLAPSKVKEMLGSDLFPSHGYTELYIEGKWVKATPAFGLKMCQQNHLIPIEFDGKHDATFHSHTLDGKPHIEYVQDHGNYDDLPFDKIVELRVQTMGPDWRERLRRAIEERKTKAA